MVTLALDLDDLLAQSAIDEDADGHGETNGAARDATIAPDTTIGHVHLKVADVPRALAFYRDTLGFEEQAQLPSAAFLSAGGYHHHIGLNSWQSAGASPAPESTPALREIDFELDDGEPRVLTDPDGVTLRFSPASAPAPARD